MREKELEDWLFTHSETFNPAPVKMIRQVPLEHGRADLVGWFVENDPVLGVMSFLGVIELKRDKLRPEHVAQVLMYTYDIRDDLMRRYPAFAESPSGGRKWLEDRLYGQVGNPLIVPQLIGRSIDDKTLCIALEANVWVRLWKHEGEAIILDAPQFTPRRERERSQWHAVLGPEIEQGMSIEAQDNENRALAEIFMGDAIWETPFVIGEQCMHIAVKED